MSQVKKINKHNEKIMKIRFKKVCGSKISMQNDKHYLFTKYYLLGFSFSCKAQKLQRIYNKARKWYKNLHAGVSISKDAKISLLFENN